MFPRKSDQDPLLLDEARELLAPPEGGSRETVAHWSTRAERSRRERVLLHLAAGAATERLYVSYPRLDVAEGRERVPSFYALDVLRGATGTIPDLQRLKSAAAAAGDSTLAWPAPKDPAEAIDDQEHDLSVLRTLLEATDRRRRPRARAIPAPAERVAAPIGHRTVGPRPDAMVAPRWADARDRRDARRSWSRSGFSGGLFDLGAAEVQRLPVSVLSERGLSARAGRTSRAAAAARPAHARQHRPSHPGGHVSRARAAQRAAGDGRDRESRAHGPRGGDRRRSPTNTRSGLRRRSIASGRRRSR